MIEITKTVSVTINLSAFDMGREFAKLSGDQQAQFFNGIASEVSDWKKPACFKWHMMRVEMSRLPQALSVFKDMAEYALADEKKLL